MLAFEVFYRDIARYLIKQLRAGLDRFFNATPSYLFSHNYFLLKFTPRAMPGDIVSGPPCKRAGKSPAT